MADLFSTDAAGEGVRTPLAERLRPKTLAELVGQDHLLAPEAPLGRMARQRRLASMILFGPPGTGKTTIARLLAAETGLAFVQISAVFSGVADLKKAFDAARALRASGRSTLLFVDEIHRFNRAQQDGFLPYVEEGLVTLVGATTENPSFELNAALLSRTQVFVLNALDRAALRLLLSRAEAALGRALPLTEAGKDMLCAMAAGDGRYLLSLAEEAFALPEDAALGPEEVAAALQRRAPLYDKNREEHYNLISALHKSLRGSDPDASLYWLARMLQGGEDPLFIARRLVRAAAEDVGMADPTALLVAVAAKEAVELIGMPEAELHLAQAALHIASAPKSNSAYIAWKRAAAAARATAELPPPNHIRNAATKLMREWGYGKGYAYDHDDPDGFSGQSYFPVGMKRPQIYEPTARGREQQVKERLERLAQLRVQKQGGGA